MKVNWPAFLLVSLLLAAQAEAQKVTVLAGGGAREMTEKPQKATDCILHEPFSIDFLADGRIVGVEFIKTNHVFVITPDGQARIVGGVAHASTTKPVDLAAGDGGDAAAARFNGLHDVAVGKDNSTLFLADTFNNRIRAIIGAHPVVSTIAGNGKGAFGGDGGPMAGAQFNQPHCVSLNQSKDKILIADLGNQRVRLLDLKKSLVSTVAGNGQKGVPQDGAKAVESPLNGPRAVAVDSQERVYICTREGNAVHRVEKDGTIRTLVNRSGQKGYTGDGEPAIDAKLNGPKYLCMDAEDRLLIVDTENHAIRRFDPKTGRIELVAGTPPKAGDKIGNSPLETQLKRPHGVRFDPQNRLVIADSENNRLLRIEK